MGGRIESRIFNPTIDPGAAISGTGANTQVAYFNGTNTLTSSANLLFTGTQLAVAAGNAGAPGYAFTGDLDTGMFGRAANQIGFSCGGVETGFTNGDWSLGADLNSVVTIKGRTLVGNGVASTQFSIFNGSNSCETYISGGNSIAVGGNIRLDGGASGGPNKLTFRVDATDVVGITAAQVMTVNGQTILLSPSAAPTVLKYQLADSSGLKFYQDNADNSYVMNHYSGNLVLGSGNVNILTVTSVGNNIGGFRKDQDAATRLLLTNGDAGASALCQFKFATTAGDLLIQAGSTAAGAACYMICDATYTGGLTVGTDGVTPFAVRTNAASRLVVDGAGNTAIGTAAILTTATDGFLYIPTCAGTPTGVPTAKTGLVPMVFDTSNNKFYIYDGGWIGIVLS